MIKVKSLVPWLLAAGFALLFFSTLITKTPEKISPAIQTPPATQSEKSARNATQYSLEGEKEAVVVRVIDGDTIELADGTRVRYIGIDTPETGQCGGEIALKENAQLVENKKVILETDIQKYDKYGRLLAYVFVDSVSVNEDLLKRGIATVTTYPPNVKYVDRFLKAQQEAKEQEKGVWTEGICTSASLLPSLEGVPLQNQPATECTIKGNINSSGEKIYHMPGQRYYERTKIEEGKGERRFCTEEEAKAAGWRKSKI